MKKEQDRKRLKPDRIEGERIFLDGTGKFPKEVVILEPGKRKEYRLVRTGTGKYLLN